MFIFLIILAVLSIFILLASYYAYRKTFYYKRPQNYEIYRLPMGEQYEPHHKKMTALMRELEEAKGERLSISSYDGKVLFGTYYHVSDGAPLHIQMHGYKGHFIRDFCGGNKMAREMGHNSLVIEQRSHSQSKGGAITFGIKERRDCLSWINYANERFGKDTPIFLSGVSMGAATVLMAAGLDLPQNVRGIMADCPYDSPKDIIKKVSGELGLPPSLVFPFVWVGALLFGHFNLTATTVENSLKNAKIPILLVHGDDDRFVPVEMSKSIYASRPDLIELHIFEGAGHGMSYMVDEEGYTKLSKDFVKKLI